MFKIIRLGLDEFLFIPIDPMGGPAAMLVILVMSLFLMVLLSLIKDILFLPILLLVIALGFAFAFAMSNALWPLVVTGLLVFLYGFEAFMYGMLVETVNTENGILALFFWVLLGCGLLVLSFLLMAVHILIGLPVLFYSFFLWFLPFNYAGSDQDPVGFKYLFRVTYILFAILILALLLLGFKKDNKEDYLRLTPKGLLTDAASFVIGFVPVTVASLLASANSLFAMIVVLALYGGAGFLIHKIASALRDDTNGVRPSIGPMMLPLVVAGLVSYFPEVNPDYLVPYGFFPGLYDVFHNGITEAFAAGVANVAAGLNGILSGLFYLIASLVVSIFDGKLDSFMMPDVMAYSFAFIFIAMLAAAGGIIGKVSQSKT